MTNRRDFLKRGALVGGALMLHRDSFLTGVGRDRPRALDLLVLGGTGFIGPHLVRHAVSRGHRVTIFTRGRHDADLPANVIRLQGDRGSDLTSLAGKSWDAVVDDSATNPDWVRRSSALLKESVGRYLFTSSTGVYYPYRSRGIDESGQASLEAADPKDGSATYGVAKAQCERVVMSTFVDRGVVVRPTYIVGPGDTTDRFPYWPQRLARGGEVLAPGRRDDPAQFIDVRDLAEFMVTLLEDSKDGVFNVVGPKDPITFPEFLEQARAALDAKAQFTWVDDDAFLERYKIDEAIPWALLKGNDFGMMSIRNDKARAAGLAFRPLATTVRDTLAWWSTVPASRRAAPKFTITAEQETAALAAWHARTG